MVQNVSRIGLLMQTRRPEEILAFIAAAERFPETPEKLAWVRWLDKQFTMTCTAEVIKAEALTFDCNGVELKQLLAHSHKDDSGYYEY